MSFEPRIKEMGVCPGGGDTASFSKRKAQGQLLGTKPGMIVNSPVESYKEYTEEDVTDQMVKGPFSFKPAENESSFFPGLRSDFDAIERHLFSGIGTLFRAAEDMGEFFNSVCDPRINDDQASSSYMKPGTDKLPNESVTKKKSDLDVGDLSRFASDV